MVEEGGVAEEEEGVVEEEVEIEAEVEVEIEEGDPLASDESLQEYMCILFGTRRLIQLHILYTHWCMCFIQNVVDDEIA